MNNTPMPTLGAITLSRRALLWGAAAAAVVSVPASGVPLPEPDPVDNLAGHDLARHYAGKLAAAMDSPEFVGTWTITIKSGDAHQPMACVLDLVLPLPAKAVAHG